MQVKTFLASPQGQRFIKLVGMLGSNGDGERANASAMANRLLQEAGLTWAEVLGGAGTSQGGQATRIADLEARNRILNNQLSENNKRFDDFVRQDKTQKQEIARLRRELGDALQQLKVANQAFEMAGAGDVEFKAQADAFFRKADEGGLKTGKKTGKDKWSSKLNRQINELADRIESAIELNAWEQGFLASIRDLKWKISPKQADRLRDMADAAGVEFGIDLD